jgi:putative ABC transport system permease protein
MSAWLYDVRQAIASAWRRPSFTVLIVGVLSLGIGAAVAMFSVLNAVVLRPLPYGDPARLMWLWSIRADGVRTAFALQELVDLRDRDTGTESIGAFAPWSGNLTGVGSAERLQGMRTSANAFDVLQVHAVAGRVFQAGDDADGRSVVLGHGLWLRRFGGDPSIVGRSLTLNGASYTVIGVLPASFVFPIRNAELAVPIVEAQARRVEGDVSFMRLIARLRPGVTRAQAEGQLTAVAVELRKLRPQSSSRKVAITLTPLHEQIVGDYAATLCLLLIAVALVLLLACVNLAALTLARTAARQRELAVRTALGVGRGRLAVQLLTESLVPAILAGGLGLTLAAFGARALLALAPATMPRAADTSIDWRVVLFAIGVTIVTGVAVGLAPAWHLSRVDPAAGLGGHGRTSGSRRSLAIRRWLVGAEVAISLVLAVATALLLQSFKRVTDVDPGFDTTNVLSMRLSLARDRYPDRERILAFQRNLAERLRALPGVTGVGGVSLLPLGGMRATVDVAVDGRPFRSDDLPEAEYRVATPGYFDTMGIQLLRGRGFDERDVTPGIEVAIVNKTMADRLWPNQNALGSHLLIEPGTRALQRVEVVGVVGDVKHYGLDSAPTMDLYVPFAQLPERNVVWVTNNQFWAIRTGQSPMTLASAARAALASADPDVPAADVRTLEQAVDSALAVRRFSMWIVALFGYAALGLTACGIYAVSAHSVAERSLELGIRAALGASPRGLLALAMRTEFACVIVGIGAGLIVARMAASAMHGMLFAVAGSEPGPYVVVSLLLAAVAAAACSVPAVRAARTDPRQVMRE